MILALLTIHLLNGSAPSKAVELEKPGVDYRVEIAGATAAPWVTASGWRFQRSPEAPFISHAAGPDLPLAMAEANAWRGNVWFQVSKADRPLFDKTLAFLQSIPEFPSAPRAQIGVEDDGTPEVGEVLKLLARRNLMAEPLQKNGPKPELVVKLGTPDFTRESARNPAAFAAAVRRRLGDEHRLLRIYGTDVVLGHLEGDARHTRLHLVNYSNHDVSGARVRVLGAFPSTKVTALGQPDLALKDVTLAEGGTEFTIPTLTRYAVVDLTTDQPALAAKHIDRDFQLTADPAAPQWQSTAPVLARQNYLGEPVPFPPTEIRSRWTDRNLYVLFSCPYDSLNLKPNPDTRSETPKLWTWDVAEAFIGSDFDHPERYRELQVSPQGEWVDLDIDRSHPKPDGGMGWNSGFTVKARIDRQQKVWYGEMKIPLSAFSPPPGKELRVGLFRIQGGGDQKQYIAWRPTGERSFHVPQAFGILRLEP